MRVFVAGATGAIGQHLVPRLVAARHEVTGSTRSAARATQLTQAGVIVHQMTALGGMPDFRRFDAEFAATNELRTRGTEYLLAAGRQAGTRRFIVQSFTGWPGWAPRYQAPRRRGPRWRQGTPLRSLARAA